MHIDHRPSVLAIACATLAIVLANPAAAQIGAAVKKGAAPAIAGTWENNDAAVPLTLLLLPDLSGEFNGTPLRYSLGGSKLTLSVSGSQPTTYSFSLAGNKLTLSGGDLSKALTFVKSGPAASTAGTAAKAPSAGIEGVWEGYGETMEFQPGGIAVYLNQRMRYSVSGGTLTLISGQQTIPMNFAISGNRLTLSVNGKQLEYTRKGSGGGASGAASAGGTARGGVIAPEIVGTWAWINVSSGNSGGASSSTYIIIKQDGTFEYHSEGSTSVNGSGVSGGTASQGNDRGTWRLEGNILHVQSQSSGAVDYRFEKRNHPKTGDPMIVIDGQPYVTYYQKAPWR